MITYKMTITNPERCDKTVWVTGENYYEAVAKGYNRGIRERKETK